MKSFILEGTMKTPTIRLDPDSGELEFSGKSIPENSVEFYRPVLEWIDHYLHQPGKKTLLLIKLEYFNTSSSKSLIEIFRKFEKLFQSGQEVLIQWFYEQEDEDMFESGEDIREIIKIPVELKVI